FAVRVQLEATTGTPAGQEGRFPLRLPLPHYNTLRDLCINLPRVMIVLFLPANPPDRLLHSEDGLITRRSVHCVTLHEARPSPNERYQTVYLPRSQVLSAEGLTALMTRLSRREALRYEA